MDEVIEQEDIAVLQNLKGMYTTLRNLKLSMLEAEEAFKLAKMAYQKYAQNDLPDALYEAGLGDDNGNIKLPIAGLGIIKCSRKFYCSPNKNDEDRQVMVEWLKEHGGDFLISSKASVDGDFIGKLRDDGIPYSESVDINTNSLKAFLTKEVTSVNGSGLQMDEIPNCMHFCEVATADIELW